MSRPRINRLFTGGLPQVHGDKYRPADRIIDMLYLEGKLGDIISNVIPTPCIVSGLVVTQGTGTTLNISAGSAILKDNQTPSFTNNDYNGAATAAVTIAPFPSLADYAGVTNMAIGGATLDGSTINYVKGTITDASAYTRGNLRHPSPVYAYAMSPQIVISVDTVAPTSNEILLSTFVGTVTFAFTADPAGGTRAYPISIKPSTDKAALGSSGLTYIGNLVTGTKARHIFQFENELNHGDSMFMTVLQDSVANNGLIAFTRTGYYGQGGESIICVMGRRGDATTLTADFDAPLVLNSVSPAEVYRGPAAGSRWMTQLAASNLLWFCDSTSLVTNLGGSIADVVFKGDTYKAKAQITAGGTLDVAGQLIFRSLTATSIKGSLYHANSSDRTYQFPDKSGTVALIDDVNAVGAVQVGDIVTKLFYQAPSPTFPYLALDAVDQVLDAIHWNSLVPVLRAAQIYVGGAASFSFTGFAGTGSQVTITLASNAANQALVDCLDEDILARGGGANRVINITATVNDLVAGDYQIVSVTPGSLHIVINSSAVSTGSGALTVYPFRIAGSATTAQWYRVASRGIITPSDTKVGGLLRRYRQVKHNHPASKAADTYAVTTLFGGGSALTGGATTGNLNTVSGAITVTDPTDSGTGAGAPLLENQNEIDSLVAFKYVVGGTYLP